MALGYLSADHRVVGRLWIVLTAQAGTITLTVSSPQADDEAFIDFARTIGQLQRVNQKGVLENFSIVVPTGLATPIKLKKAMAAEDKAKALVAQMQTDFPKVKKFISQGMKGANPTNEVIVDMNEVAKATMVPPNKPGFDTIRYFFQDAAEAKDQMVAKDPAASAEIEFDGAFNAVGVDGLSSLFTGGILVGSVDDTVNVIASTITGSLTGDVIAQSVFNALVSDPSFSSLNVTMAIDLDPATEDGTIFINFAQGLTADAGVVFGTTSATGGVGDVLSMVVPEPSTLALLAAGLPALIFVRRRRRSPA